MMVIIRCDLGHKHGLGHSVRMHALARTLAAAGVEVAFVTQTPTLAEFVAPFPCYRQSHEMVPRSDVCVYDTKMPLQDGLLDVYSTWTDGKMVCIDRPDVAPEQCHILIAPVAHWDTTTVTRLRATFGERFLYGWDYVMLDESVTSQEPLPYEDRQNGPIVFCAGGSDPSGALQKMYDWTTDFVLESRTNLIFVEGLYAPKLRWRPHAMQQAIVDGTRYHEMLRHAALVVGMFGVSCYEAMWWHTPVLCTARTPEDGKAAWALWYTSGHQVWPLNPPDLGQWEAEGFCATLAAIMADRQWRQEMADGSVGLLDGRGVQRVAEAILKLGGGSKG